MKKVDLHVHSKYSPIPSEWILRQMGMMECYTEIEDVYRIAKQKGMDYVTVTDHNSIDGILKLNAKYPADTFTGVEVTTKFPEDGCKMHVLLYDITKKQFDHVDKIRSNIYELRDYIIKMDIPYSVAHATYAVNGRLTMDVWEKLILMFDVFEGINGCRNPYFNYSWIEALQSLTPQRIDQLYKKHHIEPMSRDPWVKGFTGGSDDHAGLFIGETWTDFPAKSRDHFLQSLRDKKTFAKGRNNDYKGMAFIFYKIMYDHTEGKHMGQKNKLLGMVNNIVFKGSRPSIKETYILQRVKRSKKKKERVLAGFVERLDQNLSRNAKMPIADKINIVYDQLGTLCDDFIQLVVKKTHKDIDKGNLMKWVNDIRTIFPVTYLTLPFISTWMHLNKDRPLLEQLRGEYIGEDPHKDKRVCWFTDTILDLNGVSVTINNMHRCARAYNVPLYLVTSNPKMPFTEDPADHVVNLPSHFQFTPEFYKDYTMNFPSLLKSLEMIEKIDPKEIVISTPGPVGLVGYLIAKILSIPCTGIYHSDFGAQLSHIMGDGYSPVAIEKFTNMFYEKMDTISVPTKEYIDILTNKGLPREKMKVFKRGIDSKFFDFDLSHESSIREKYGIKDGFTLIYAGRVSKDKNLKFLAKVYDTIRQNKKDVNLIIAGKGPHLEDIKEIFKDYPRVIFTGQVQRKELAQLFSFSDLLVFPSTTDTFGMVVLEALSCGLPALVSDQGGPQEIIPNDQTGTALSVHRTDIWVDKIFEYIHFSEFDPEKYIAIRSDAREHVAANYSMEAALEHLLQRKLPKKKIASKKKLTKKASMS